ncbi:MAG: N-acetylmuramoyl-L-alanine amidase [Rhizobiaceae bacterium]
MFALAGAALAMLLFFVATAKSAGSAGQTLVEARVSGDSVRAVVELEFEGAAEATPSLLAAPHRLILDMPETRFAIGEIKPKNGSLLSSVRYGLVQKGRSRIVFAVDGPFALQKFSSQAGKAVNRQIVTVTLAKSDDRAFAKSLANQLIVTSAVTGGKGDRVVQGASSTSFNVIIDPGHGGIDGGATGVHGIVEKDVTLDFSRQLASRLNTIEGITARLTREDDRFIALDERVRIARQLDAHLFISVHADTIRDKSLRGATVYTLSDKASDEVAHAVAQQENLSDAIGGVDVKVEDQSVADILIDLTRRETMQFSTKFARALVQSLKNKTKMINNPHRSAGFRVLKAPDVPSVLVELGYLSNPDDEKAVSNPAWQSGVLEEMVAAIGAYAAQQIAMRQQ